jgi:hypothetical protein
MALIILTVIGDIILAVLLHGARGGALIVGNEIVVFVAAFIAGGISARIGSSRPLWHATLLGAIVFIVGVAVSAVQHSTHGAPAWYPYTIAVLGGVGAFAGGALTAEASR